MTDPNNMRLPPETPCPDCGGALERDIHSSWSFYSCTNENCSFTSEQDSDAV